MDKYKVTDFLLTSMSNYLHTTAYDTFIQGVLGAFDEEGDADMALCYAAIFWPRFSDEIAGKSSVTDAETGSILNTILNGNAEAFRFAKVGYGDYSYVPPYIQDVWSLQLAMTDDANMTDSKAKAIRAKEHYAEARRFLKARAAVDTSLVKYASYWN